MDPINDYYGMEMWKQMLGMSANPYAPPRMQYYSGQQQGQQKQQGGGSSMNNQMLKQLMSSGSTSTGMTPNATNAYGEPYSGWGAQTGDWGAVGSGANTGSGLIAGNEIAAPGAFAEVGSAADIGTVSGGAGESAGLMSGAGPYAALAAAIGAFKLNSDWMAGGSGKTWGGEMEEAWSESFGNNGLWGMFKGLFG